MKFCLVVVIVVVALFNVTTATLLPHIFAPVREYFREIDLFLREEDATDRKELDQQVGLFAEQVRVQEGKLNELNLLVHEVRQDKMYLEAKIRFEGQLLDAYIQKKSVIETQLSSLDHECGDETEIFQILESHQTRRVSIWQAMVDEVATTSTESKAPLELKSLNSLSVLMNHTKSEQRVFQQTLENSICLFKKTLFQLKLSQTVADIDTLTQNGVLWRRDVDWRARQLASAVPKQAEMLSEIAFLRSEIAVLSNAFYARHRSRSLQLCETVTSRHLVETEPESQLILPALLPGPGGSHNETRTMVCASPRHIHIEVPVTRYVPCSHPEPSLNGRVPLPSEWAEMSSELDCQPIKAVDVENPE
jgi:hypothetical protein